MKSSLATIIGKVIIEARTPFPVLYREGEAGREGKRDQRGRGEVLGNVIANGRSM